MSKRKSSKPSPWTSDDPRALDEDALGGVLESLERGNIEEFRDLSPKQREFVLHLVESLQQGDKGVLEALYSVDYERVPVEPDVFFTETDYMGHMGKDVFRKWWGHLMKVADPDSGVYELILTGAIGTGKTLVSMLLLAYKIYRISCLREPARYFGLAKKSRIVFGVYSLTLDNAEDVGFYKLRDQCLDESPYFREVFPRRPYGTDYIEWPQKNLKVITGSSALHAIGKDLFAIMIDEINFMAKGVATAAKAHELATAVSRRLESRFMTGMGTQDIPGICIFVSSKKAETDYLQQRIGKVQGLPGVHVVDGPLWDFNEKIDYSGRKFRLMLGDAINDPMLLDEVRYEQGRPVVIPALTKHEEARIERRVIDVPIEHYKPFAEDLNGAIRDVAGVATSSVVSFFPRKKIIQEMFKEGEGLPLYFGRTSIQLPLRKAVKLTEAFDIDRACRVEMSKRVPIRHSYAPRYIHVDLAKNTDAVGIVMLHPSEFTFESKEEVQGTQERGIEKTIEVDFALRVTTDDSGEDIDFKKIVEFIVWLKTNGFWIRRVTYDSYQSVHSIQELKTFGIDAGVRSVDKSVTPYVVLRRTMSERSIACPFHPVLERELGELEHNLKNDKVDHPKVSSSGERGSKDVSDALAASNYECIIDKLTPSDSPPQPGAQKSPYEDYLEDVKALEEGRTWPI